MWITTFNTPKSVIRVKSNDVSSVSPQPCSAACFAPLLSLCCRPTLPSGCPLKDWARGWTCSPLSPPSTTLLTAFSQRLGHLWVRRTTSLTFAPILRSFQTACVCLVSLDLVFTSLPVLVRKHWLAQLSRNFTEYYSKLQFTENKWKV